MATSDQMPAITLRRLALVVEKLNAERSGFFEIDTDGGLMPSDNPTLSDAWELDADGNIQPKGE